MEVSPKIKDSVFCAILGELAHRSISFLISKWWNRMSPTEEAMERLDSLRRLLLRVGAILEEAEGRHIPNQAMLQQLDMLREEMYKGCYTLDTFRCRAQEGDKLKDHQVSDHSFAVSKFSPAKRLTRTRSGSSESVKQLRRVLESLETVTENLSEVTVLLISGRYPRLFRQPCSAYLLLDKCMFGRQMEVEHVVSFLLQAGTPGAEHLGVLPIVGPGKVGKSTLVEHACIDERVRDHFSQIVSLSSGDDLEMEERVTLAPDGSAERVLIIVEVDGDIDEGSWRRLHSASRTRAACGSKIIVTSRSHKIASLGTTLPLNLRFLTPEAYWYFFKVRTFGSMDVTEHPKLASIAMDIARELNGCFIAANIFRGILKSNMNASFWSLALATFREFRQRNRFLFSTAHPVDPWEMTAPVHVPTPSKYSFVIRGQYQTASTHSEAQTPTLTVQDVMYGNARPQGKFALLACRSHIPPHYNYVFNCEVRRTTRVVSRKKRSAKIGRS